MLLPAARLLRRDLQSGRLTVMLLATTLACAATTAVSLFVERVERALVAESSALLAADLAVVSNDPLPEDYFDLAAELDLRVARLAAMRSVVAHADQLQLVELKAAGRRYPLRGSVRISPTPFAPVQAVPHGPDPGTVWADAWLLQILDVAVGDELTIGAVRLRIAAVLVLEPDRGGDVFSIAPRLLMHLVDLPSTALIMPGSRVRYTLLIAGDASAGCASTGVSWTCARDTSCSIRARRVPRSDRPSRRRNVSSVSPRSAAFSLPRSASRSLG